ncbi:MULTISPECIES: zinc ribbon domain-containing protein [Paenibacillus]|uniref:zinc ribbon domain-containing protein n=1 Tax=Paenibacillus TaxID=44249 RepID=UPI0011A89E07|nr:MULTISPECIES: zinc ribbon domain-containing protein [Paenibacillus]
MAVKICPKCGESNPEQAWTCVRCGSSLQNAEVAGTPDADKGAGISLGRDENICPACGEQLEPGARKCKFCGTTIYKKPAAPIYEEPDEDPFRPSAVSIILLILATVVFPPAGLIIGGVAVVLGDPDKRIAGQLLMVLGLIVIAVKYFF